MIEVTRVAPEPVPDTIQIEVDERTARALKVLTGLGTIHFAEIADSVAEREGFPGMSEVMHQVSNENEVYTALSRVGI